MVRFVHNKTYKSPPPTYALTISHLCHCCFTCSSLPLKTWVSSPWPSPPWETREARESRVSVPVVVRSLSSAEGENVGGSGSDEGEKLRQTIKASCHDGSIKISWKRRVKRKRTGTTLTATPRFPHPYSTAPSLWIIPFLTLIPLLLHVLSLRINRFIKLFILPKRIFIVFRQGTCEETRQLGSQKFCAGIKR